MIHTSFHDVTDFRGWGLGAAGQDLWRSAYLIVLAGAVLLSLLAVALTLTHQLTTYGKVHSQSRREVRRNGLMQPLGAGLVFGKSASRTRRAALCPAATTGSRMFWSPCRPSRAKVTSPPGWNQRYMPGASRQGISTVFATRPLRGGEIRSPDPRWSEGSAGQRSKLEQMLPAHQESAIARIEQ